MKEKSFNKSFFDDWDVEMSYVLGFMFADGYISRNSRGSWYFSFVSTDKDVIRKIKDMIDSDHKIGERDGSSNNRKKSYRLQIGSKKVCKTLREKYGIVQNKSKKIEFPNVPEKYLPHFVRGYFDGDGSINKGVYNRNDRPSAREVVTTNFTSSSENFLKSLHSRLDNSVTDGGHINSNKSRGSELVFAKKDSVALFDFLYNNATRSMCLNRKYDEFKEVVKGY